MWHINIVVLVTCFLSIESMAATSSSKASPPPPLNSEYYITPTELATLKGDALSGSATAAHRVMMYYGYWVFAPRDERYWAMIGAENGDATSQVFLADLLARDGGEENCRRATFWLKKAEAQGYHGIDEEKPPGCDDKGAGG